MKNKLSEILNFLEVNQIKYINRYEENLQFDTFSPLKDLKENSITWCKKIEKLDCKYIKNYKNLIIFVDIGDYTYADTPLLYVDDLKATFFKIIDYFFREFDINYQETKIEQTATVLTKSLGKNVYVGNNSFIDSNVVIGNNVTIMHNVTIQGKVEIGNDCFIESGATIGTCGFGSYFDIDGHPHLVSHVAGVKIGNHVKIFANTCIVRGCLSDTVIHDYAMIDNLCHIAHNVEIGENTQIAASSEISGSAKIGKNNWIAPGVTVINGVDIGDGTFTGIASNVIKDLPNNVLVYGNPAKIKEDKNE